MKKLMIIAAAVMAVVGAKAAAIDWSASKVVDPWASAEAGKVTPCNTWAGYVILADDYADVTAGLAAGNFDVLDKAVGSAKTSTTKGAFNTSAASGSVAAGEQSFYLIVLNNAVAKNATYFYASDEMKTTIDPSLDTTVVFGSQQTKSAEMSNWTAVAPEPTSGLLLLLGVAGLALRRRRA